MGTASRTVIFRFFCTVNFMIEEQIPTFRHIHAAFPNITACCRLGTNRLQLTLHGTHYDLCNSKANRKGNYDPNRGQWFLWQVRFIKGIAISCLSNELIAKPNKCPESFCIIPG